MRERYVGLFLVVLGSLSVGCLKRTVVVKAVPAQPNNDQAVSETTEKSPWRPLENVVVEEGILPPLPRAVTSFGAATVGSDIYALGGYFGTPHKYSKDFQAGELWRLRDGASKWETLQPMEMGAQGLALVAHQGQLYRVGGMVAENDSRKPSTLRSVPTVARFRPGRGVWESLADLPTGRSSHDAIVVGDRIFVIGGWELRGKNQPVWHSTMLIGHLGGTRPEWETATVPFKRRGLALAQLGSRVAVIGGMNESGKITSRVDLYNPKTRRWSRAPDFPGTGFGVAATGKGNTLYASGAKGVLYKFEDGAPNWQKVGKWASPRFFHRLVMKDSQNVIALGGIRGRRAEGRVRVTESLPVEPPKKTAGYRLSSYRFANPLRAKNRQGLFFHKGTLFVFGGNTSLEQHDFEPENFLNAGARIHLPSLTWRPIAPLPEKRQTMQTALSRDGRMALAVGGFGHDGESAKAHGDVFEYNLDDDEWTKHPHGLPEPRTQFGLAIHDDRVWVFGGLNYDDTRPEGEQFRHKKDVISTSFVDDEPFVDTKANMPRGRRAFASAQIGKRIYVVGGMRENFSFVQDAMHLDLGSSRWKAMAKPKRPRLSAELVALGGKLYLLGGTVKTKGGETKSEPSVEVYDPAKGTWRTFIKELPFDTKHIHAFAAEGKLVIYSAHLAEQEVRVATIAPL